jgi:ABC-2 family transporter protein
MRSFAHLVRAEWTKLRSVPAWGLTMLAAVLLTVVVSLLGATGSVTNENEGSPAPQAPNGVRVVDRFHFVHRAQSGDGSITARVEGPVGQEGPTHEWAKAGIMIKQSAEPGAAYAAMMITGGHGVRFQGNFVVDRAGSSGTGERWLRLTRAGDTVTGFESPDGRSWREVGALDLGRLPAGVQVGLFVASPFGERTERGLGGTSGVGVPTVSEARFDGVRVEPEQAGAWQGSDVGESPEVGPGPGRDTEDGGTFTLTGSGDIAPNPPEVDVVRQGMTGVFVGLMAVVVVAVLFVTTEYRRGMIRTTFAASPRRGRVLAAKAVVAGGVTFVAGLVASLASFLLSRPVLRDNGFTPPAFPDPSLSDLPVLRSVAGTAAVLGLIAVLGVALAVILRRTAGAIAVAIALIVVPQFLAAALPISVGQWLMRVLPAAGFSIQQTTPRYPFVEGLCLPEDGCFVANPWTGFGVLAGYAAVALAAAFWLLRRRDA